MICIFLMFMAMSCFGSDDAHKPAAGRELSRTKNVLPLTSAQQNSLVPIGIIQNCDNYIDYVTKSGEKLQFRVRLSININPKSERADVVLQIYQGRRLVTSRDLEFVW